ncbi:hypothetical protein [Paracoccus aestuariivivens]|uniref:Phage gp6-like head-tail connector protein n=1 Tax=Paracoccus aestuariivivens TaxID=1820333 RepID=A0A6L6J4Z1_9RHOB|nr:hypothetical protein [Paracoccus aestuariivivens]MTH76318.1 hypothetical protein [Paracoccus aestuariivivens]
MRIIDAPDDLPVTVKELAEQLHFDEADAMVFDQLIAAATDVIETATNHPIQPRVVEIDLPEGCWSEFWLPCAPAIELVGVTSGRLVRPFNEPRFIREDYVGDTLQVRVGHADPRTIPDRLRRAIILLVKEWHASDITVEEAYTRPSLSFGFHQIMRQSRYRRPCEVR